MFKGISHEMMQNIAEGKSPVCAIQKRVNNGKMMAFNIGKAFGLVPSNANVKAYMNDKHKFWAQQFLAQTNGTNDLDNQMSAMAAQQGFNAGAPAAGAGVQ